MGLTMGHREDARAEELHNLRLALATFALQLDAFEMKASSALLAARREASVRKSSIAVPRPNWPPDSKRGKMIGRQ
jgi:hypothetical protein